MRAIDESLARLGTDYVTSTASIATRARCLGGLGKKFDAEDEKLVDSLVHPGHPSTPGYNDPAFPMTGRPTER